MILIAFDPMLFLIPFVIAYGAYIFYQRSIVISLVLIITACGLFICYYLIFRNTFYTITNWRI